MIVLFAHVVSIIFNNYEACEKKNNKTRKKNPSMGIISNSIICIGGVIMRNETRYVHKIERVVEIKGNF
jgi:hypothetical protein